MAEVDRNGSPNGAGPPPGNRPPPRPKFKLPDLPVSQSKRATIDGLVHTFKKKGEFDAMRKQVYAQFDSSEAKTKLLSSLEQLVDRETDRDPSLLSKDRRIAAPLIEGAAERSDIYKNALADIDTMIDQMIESAGLMKMREIRRKDIGEEAAAAEEKLGSKTDEEYAREADARREVRAKVRQEELEKELEKEREANCILEEKKRRDREEEEVREKERQEREEKRRKERQEREEREIERQREYERELEREREERRERRRREEERLRQESRDREERARERERERIRGSRGYDRYTGRGERGRSRERKRSPTPIKPINPEDINVDDDSALQALLAESEQMKKARQRPALERSESLDPPMRKRMAPKALVPRDPKDPTVEVKFPKLETKSPVIRSPIKLDIKIATPIAAPTPEAITTPAVEAPKADVPVEEKAEEKEDVAEPVKDTVVVAEEVDSKKRPRSRDRSRSKSIDRGSTIRRVASRSRSRSRGGRFDDRRGSRYYDRKPRYDRYIGSHKDRRDDRDRVRDRRDDRDSRYSPSPSRSIYSDRKKQRKSRSPSPSDRRDRDKDRDRDGSRRYRDRSPARRRYRSRSRSPKDIDRYVPSTSARAKRDDTRDREREPTKYRDYARDDRNDRRYREMDRYLPGRQDTEIDDRDRDRDRDRHRDRHRDRDGGRRRDRSASRSRSRGSRR